MGEIATSSALGGDELERLVQLTLDEARQQGVDQAEVAASHDSGLAATARLGDVENLEYTNDRGIGITVYRDSKKGSASTSDIAPAAIREAVTKACTFAEYTAEDPYAGLADAARMCSDIQDLELDHNWPIDSAAAISLAIACEDSALTFDARISNSEGATVSTNRGIRAYGNTHGFIGSYAKSSHSISCVVLGSENGEMQRDYYYSTARDPADLEDIAQLTIEPLRPQAITIRGIDELRRDTNPIACFFKTSFQYILHA